MPPLKGEVSPAGDGEVGPRRGRFPAPLQCANKQNGRACAKNTSPAYVVVNLGSFAPAGATRACAALDLRPGSPGGHNLTVRLLALG